MLTEYTCPFCGEPIEHIEELTYPYCCTSCEASFTKEDLDKEELRHKLSALLMDTSEEYPMECNILIMEDNDENCGLSSNELPLVVGAFQDSEGIIWFDIYGMSEPIEFDDLDIEDIQTIYDELSK